MEIEGEKRERKGEIRSEREKERETLAQTPQFDNPSLR